MKAASLFMHCQALWEQLLELERSHFIFEKEEKLEIQEHLIQHTLLLFEIFLSRNSS
jgi:hypothetical protein